MERESGKRTGKLAPTHKIVGVYDRKQHVKQLTVTYTAQARLRWHNAKLLVKAPILATAEEVKVAHYLFSTYRSLDMFIEHEVRDAYRNTGYVDGKQYVLKEVRGERSIAIAIAHYRSRGFRDVRAVPITGQAGS